VAEVYWIVVTMTTVGYGDRSIANMTQKLITVCIIVIGSFISSVLTLIVLNFFTLNDKERKAHISIFLLM
jgi:hypothetical protein